MFVTSLLYGIYMGLIAFFVPVVLPLYSFYINIGKTKGIGKHIFFGRFLGYIAVFLLIFLQLGDFLRSDFLAFILNISSIVVCGIIILKLLKDLIGKKEVDNIDGYSEEYIEYQDISSGYQEVNEIENIRKNQDNSFSVSFLMSLLLTLSSVRFIYWCDFSILSVILKINYKDESMGLLYILLFALAMFLMLLLLDVLFSKFARVLGKYINKLIMKPFTVTVLILFVAYIVYIVCDMLKFNVF